MSASHYLEVFGIHLKTVLVGVLAYRRSTEFVVLCFRNIPN